MICAERICTVPEKSRLPLKAGAFRLATFVEPEPLIVPVVANFDRKITRATLVASVHEPFRLSDHLPKPIQNDALSVFIAGFRERMRGRLRAARERLVAGLNGFLPTAYMPGDGSSFILVPIVPRGWSR